MSEQVYEHSVAIIGMAGRFPGAADPETLWDNLLAARSAIRPLTDEELAAVPLAVRRDPDFVPVAAAVDGIEDFDAAFFGFVPREAEVLDPQHRLFLESAWQALEDAGYDPRRVPGVCGIFGGCGFSTYLLNNLLPHRDGLDDVGHLQAGIGNDRDTLTTMTSYRLDLRGPSAAVQSACSTSLVAIHLACQSLLGGEADMMLAGGAALHIPQNVGYVYEEGGLLSPDGVFRSLDARSQGRVVGNGAGMVVLKRTEDALRDGDHIYATIAATAMNNDGVARVGFVAPGVRGQAEVMVEALACAGLEPDDISYVEAHGTGTVLGDAVELEAVSRALAGRDGSAGRCAIGSAKANIGHLDRAAGVTGVIKTALMLRDERIPPQVNFESPNPNLDPELFRVLSEPADWSRTERPRRALVNAMGLGGTNAVGARGGAPARPRTGADPDDGPHLLVLSARTESALEAMGRRLREHLLAHPELDIGDVAYTLQVGRTLFEQRRALVCRDRDEAIAALAGAPGSGDAQLEAAGQRWVDSGELDATLLHAGRARRRVPLPTYPFERRRYWIDAPAADTRDPMRATFSAPVWREAPRLLEPDLDGRLMLEGPWLVEGAPGLATRLRAAGAEITDDPATARTVLFAHDSIVELAALVRSLTGPARLVVIAPEGAVAGFARVIAQEHGSISIRIVAPGDAAPEAILADAVDPDDGSRIAYRDGRRWVQDYAGVEPPDRVLVRRGGVYLITGGLGEVGLALAEHLSAGYAARLALVSRTRRDSTRIDALEAAGALVLEADVSDVRAMEGVVAAIHARLGALHGVIHGAGVQSLDAFGPAADVGEAQVHAHLGAKLGGLEVLAELIDLDQLDFLVALSSLSAVLGAVGHGAYAAANAALDAEVEALFAAGRRRVLSVDWDAWPSSAARDPLGTDARRVMSYADGAAAFERALGAVGQLPRLVHTTGELAPRLRAAAPTRSVIESHERPPLSVPFVAPEGPVEATLAALWQEVLGVREVGVLDDFAELGGDSLMGLRVVSGARAALGLEIAVATFATCRTIRRLADHLKTGVTKCNV